MESILKKIMVIAESKTAKKALLVGVIALLMANVAYVVLFSPYPVAHDTFHDLRHSLGLPCH